MLNGSNVCVIINSGTLEREVVVSLNTMDITTEGKDHCNLSLELQYINISININFKFSTLLSCQLIL